MSLSKRVFSRYFWNFSKKAADDSITSYLKTLSNDLQKIDNTLSNLSKHLGGFTGNYAKTVEEEVGISVAQHLGYPDDAVTYSFKQLLNKQVFYEVDALITDGKVQYLIEAKSCVRQEHIVGHLKRLKKAKSIYPETAFVLFLGGPNFNHKLREECLKVGIYPVVLTGERFQVAALSENKLLARHG